MAATGNWSVGPRLGPTQCEGFSGFGALRCRHCRAPLATTLVDLGSAPPSNALLSGDEIESPEIRLPLRVLVCEQCWLVQTEDHASATELFTESYPYFSGFSSSWVEHCKTYVDEIIDRFDLGPTTRLVEIGANDGSLLQQAIARGVPCTGIEPTRGPAAVARSKGIPIVEDFFGVSLARRLVDNGMRADVTIGTNVLAHVPDINDFVDGVAILLSNGGVASFEFPHLLNLIAKNQFDTIYHEHFSYLSLTAAAHVFAASGLDVFDVEQQPTHGGSLRVFVQSAKEQNYQRTHAVSDLLDAEDLAGVRKREFYSGFQPRVDGIRDAFLSLLADVKKAGKTIVGYGAAAKANTLLNYAGVDTDLIPWIVDRNPAKQGRLMPGSRIPIVSEDCLREARPDFVILFPWNIEHELVEQLGYVRDWGAQFVVAIPELRVFA